MKIHVVMVLIATLAGCDSLPPLEDRDREKEFAELEAQSAAMQKNIHAARREAMKQSLRQ